MLYNEHIGGGASRRSRADKSEAEREAPSFLVRFRADIMGQAGCDKPGRHRSDSTILFCLSMNLSESCPLLLAPTGLAIESDRIRPDLDQRERPFVLSLAGWLTSVEKMVRNSAIIMIVCYDVEER